MISFSKQNYVPFAQQDDLQFELMHDNARPHVARVLQAFLEEHEIEALPSSAQSPDLNPIGHVKELLSRRIFFTRFCVQYMRATA